ncbi:MAG: hypothetical protein ACREKR_02970 [Candidatus Methylomirabilales bacterium]
MKSTFRRLTGVVAAVALLTVACTTTSPTQSVKSPMTPTSATKAAELRTTLNGLFGEHVLIAAVATSHALGGREAAFKGAAAGLDANSVDLSKAIGSVYGPDAEKAFLPLWRRHIGFVVDYTTGVATKDKAKQDKAVADLVQYSQDLGAFFSSANEKLPKQVVANLVKDHILTLKAVIDAQAAKDWGKVYPDLRSAAGHMQMIGDPLAEATVQKFATKFAGVM